ncbi:MAG: response regulator [Pseudomonadota bacterium]
MAYILAVDDDTDTLNLVARILESRGHRVVTALDGQEALDAIFREPPDAVILDLNLPRVHGFEVCRRLKNDPATSGIPIIMLTAAYPTVEDAARGLNMGADGYVVKPFLRDVLIGNVERLLVAMPIS